MVSKLVGSILFYGIQQTRLANNPNRQRGFFSDFDLQCLQQHLKLCLLPDLKYNIKLNSDLLCQVCQGNIWLCTVQANPSENRRQTRTLKSQGPIANTP